MKQNHIDYNSPLGISKREWTKVLGVNLALLLSVYAIAIICTLCGNDFFLLKYENERLQVIENALRGWGVFAFVQIAFATLEFTIIASYVTQAKPRFWYPIAFFALLTAADLICWGAVGSFPGIVQWIVTLLAFVGLTAFAFRKDRRSMAFGFLRLLIAMAVSLAMNGLITLFRDSSIKLFDRQISNSILFALSLEYDIALVLSLLFLSFALPLGQRKGDPKQCPTQVDAGGSSPNTTNSSQRKLPKAKRTNNELSPKTKKRLRILKAKMIAIQSIALIAIAFLPWAIGRPVEFSLVYASFCLTRLCLGFSRSLHFKSELVCVTAGAATFWLLMLLTPSVETCIIMAITYGAGTALAFRLYWELHDLILYRRAAKLDRYAMFYVAFKGNVDQRHIFGMMRMRGYDRESIDIVQAYMRREKVEAIAAEVCYSKRVVEDKLTEIAKDLYERR